MLYHKVHQAFNWLLGFQHIRVKRSFFQLLSVTNMKLKFVRISISSNSLAFRYIYKLTELVVYITKYILLKYLSRIFSRKKKSLRKDEP